MIPNILFVDDQKEPMWYKLSKRTPVARTGKQAIKMWKLAPFDTLYLDHDLGMGMNGYDVLIKCIEIRMPKKVVIISWNPVGRQRMMQVCEQFAIPYDFIWL